MRGIAAILIPAGAIGGCLGLAWFLARRNAKLRRSNQRLKAAMQETRRRFEAMQRLSMSRQENRVEAEDEKRLVDETEDSDLVHDANALFSDGVSDD